MISVKRRFLSPELASRLRAAVDTVTLTSMVPVIGYFIDDSNPFFLHGPFPWLIFAPLLLSLRYGFANGMGSALVIISVLGAGWYWKWQFVSEFPTSLVIALLMLTMVGAEFYDQWERRRRHLEQENHQLKTRMDEFTRVYQILKGSHSQLERKIGGQGKSLRAALVNLEFVILTIKNYDGEPLSGIAQPVLDFISEQASIHTAAIYSINDKNKLSVPACASVGKPTPVWPSNLLLHEALTSLRVASIRPDHGEAVGGALVVIPLLDITNKVWGVVVVNEMPLFAFHEYTLDLLAILGGRIGDLVMRRAELHRPLDIREAFERNLRRTYEEVRLHKKVPAGIVAATINSSDYTDAVLERFVTESRGIDKVWRCRNRFGNDLFLQLMPLTDSKGIEGFLRRVCTLPENGTVSDQHMSFHRWVMNTDDSVDELVSDIYLRCQIEHKSIKSDGKQPAVINENG